ncbi:hypothetical protein JCM19239_2136 [Vibrio variabilis]|uniref:Uncharacterized protein n=1 Tax=Vibrio variabilis TaxID=990271 RepID=A0ABQ0JKN1_9VIBR|nr:hypothetical protein JCM19239_2136 [Vibrio variabilis]
MNVDQVLKEVCQSHVSASKTLLRAMERGWKLQGQTEELLRLVNDRTGVMLINLNSGEYTRL